MAGDPRDPWRLNPQFVEACKRINAALIEGVRELGARWAEAEARAANPRHGLANVHWAGVLGWRNVCACGLSMTDERWHAHAHEHGVDPHGRHLDAQPCPCETTCPSVPSTKEPTDT